MSNYSLLTFENSWIIFFFLKIFFSFDRKWLFLSIELNFFFLKWIEICWVFRILYLRRRIFNYLNTCYWIAMVRKDLKKNKIKQKKKRFHNSRFTGDLFFIYSSSFFKKTNQQWTMAEIEGRSHESGMYVEWCTPLPPQ